MSYNFDDLYQAYKKIGIQKGQVIYFSGNLTLLGPFGNKTRKEVLDMHYSALREALGPDGTVVFPTHSSRLCNTDEVFDREQTKSETGVLTEYMRKLPGAVRSFHPYFSATAIGPEANNICGQNSRHSYDHNSPYAKTLRYENCTAVSLGLEPRWANSIVHYVELASGVPYRYTKEFLQPVKRNGAVQKESFYHYVTYRNCDLVRDRNKKFFAAFQKKEPIKQEGVGKGFIYGYSQRRFVESCFELMQGDIYTWLERPPEKRPFRT